MLARLALLDHDLGKLCKGPSPRVSEKLDASAIKGSKSICKVKIDWPINSVNILQNGLAAVTGRDCMLLIDPKTFKQERKVSLQGIHRCTLEIHGKYIVGVYSKNMIMVYDEDFEVL